MSGAGLTLPLLFQQLPETSRGLPCVPGTAATERAFLAACRRVRYCFHAACPVMDPSALPKNRRLTQDDLKARTRPVTPPRPKRPAAGWKPSSTP